MRDTKYAKELATAEVRDARIERIHVKGEGQDEIRFAWWPDGRMANRPLDLPEDMLLELFREAMGNAVFRDEFLTGLLAALAEHAQFPKSYR